MTLQYPSKILLWNVDIFLVKVRTHLIQLTHGRHFADDTFKRIFLNDNVIISIKISLNFVSNDQYSSIGSDNGLAPARRQAIIWTHDG